MRIVVVGYQIGETLADLRTMKKDKRGLKMGRQINYGHLEELTDIEKECKRANRPINLLSALLVSVGLGGLFVILVVLL